MSAAATSEQRPPADEASTGTQRPLDVLFVLSSLAMLRCFQSTLELLVERGHRVRLLAEVRATRPVEAAWVGRMLERPNFAFAVLDSVPRDVWRKRSLALRQGMAYLQFLGPEYEGRPRYLRKAL